MNYRILFLLLIFVGLSFSRFSGIASDCDSEDLAYGDLQRTFLDLELGNISDYDEETLEAANEGFFHWEEREASEAEGFLKKAAIARHSYSMPKYALILLDSEHLIESQHIKKDIYQAADLMLMAAMRGVEMACDYVEDIDKQAKKISAVRDAETGEQCIFTGLIETVKSASKKDITKWLKGGFPNRKEYPAKIKDALKLFYLSVLPKLEGSPIAKLEQTVFEELKAISSQKGQELIGKRVTDIHGYVSKILKLDKETKEAPVYKGQSQSQYEGPHNYAYYNTRHKYAYDLDISMRTLNCAVQNKLLGGGKFVKTQAEPMAAGPVYDSLRQWEPNGKESINLPGATAFIVDSFYKDFTKIFYGHPLWLVELTHMEEPWEKINTIIKEKYGGKWPKTEGPYSKDKEEFKKRNLLKQQYQEKTETYVSQGSSRNSISYRLFLIGMVNRINKSFTVSEDRKKINIDLRYISKERLLKCGQEISQVETFVILYGASHKAAWLNKLITERCKHIHYSVDKRYSYKKFENFLFSLGEKYKINIENIEKETLSESQSSSGHKVKQEQKRRKSGKEIEIYLSEVKKPSEEDGVLTLDMSKYSKKTIESTYDALANRSQIRIINLTSVNQSWIIPALKQNSNLDLDSFSYSPQTDESGKPTKPLRMMENLIKTLVKGKEILDLETSVQENKREREEASEEGWKGKKKKKIESPSKDSKRERERASEEGWKGKKKKKIESPSKDSKRERERASEEGWKA
ncbi:hypothetical protein [Candidatus Paracaedibacter symbiosus]|uniref:hypothetical protein n=1 Tax=Candidatus Paracaedibacter symbiosus TaxID=244582 RepID=UPI000509E062|nr:hypothetical protein [Candidatus Paracaedibacter symbiosus]